MGFALGFLKGVADGINTEAALEKQKELDYQKQLVGTKIDIANRTKDLFTFNVKGDDGNTYSLPFQFTESDAGDAKTEVNDNAFNVAKQLTTPINELDGYKNLSYLKNNNNSIGNILLETGQGKALDNALTSWTKYGSQVVENRKKVLKDKIFTPKDLIDHQGFYTDKNFGGLFQRYVASIIKGNGVRPINTLMFRNITQTNANGETQTDIHAVDLPVNKLKTVDETGKFVTDKFLSFDDVTKKLQKVAPYLKQNQVNGVLTNIANESVTDDVSRENYLSAFVYLSDIFGNDDGTVKDFDKLNAQDIEKIKKLYDANPELSANPMVAIDLLTPFLSNSYSRTAGANEDEYLSIGQFHETVLGIKDFTKFRSVIEGTDKVLATTDRIISMLDTPKAKNMPIGGLARLMLTFNGLANAPLQLTGVAEGLTENRDREKGLVSRVVGKIKNAFGIDDAGAKSLEDDYTTLNNNTTKANQNLRDIMDGYGDISDEEKIERFEANKNANPDSAEARAYKTAEAAMLNYYSYILAFQMAAAVQGNGDSRTISDKDVRLFQNAIGNAFFRSRGDYLAVIKEIDKTMRAKRAVGERWSYGQSKGIKGAKAAYLLQGIQFAGVGRGQRDVVTSIARRIDSIASDGTMSTDVRNPERNKAIDITMNQGNPNKPASDVNPEIFNMSFDYSDKLETEENTVGGFIDSVNKRFQKVVRPDENGQFPAGTETRKIGQSSGNPFEVSLSEVDLIGKFLRNKDFDNLFTKIVKDKGVEASKQFYKNVMNQIPDDRTRRIIDILIDKDIVKNIQGNR